MRLVVVPHSVMPAPAPIINTNRRIAPSSKTTSKRRHHANADPPPSGASSDE